MSNGRAEVILGRGSFTESFPLFGYSLDDYDDLFEQKLAIFAALRDADRTGEPVHWKGTVRSPLEGVRIHPPVERPPLRTWVGVGGSPESVVRAARYRFPLTLAIIGGDPRRFAPYVELYHRALAQLAAVDLVHGSVELSSLCWDGGTAQLVNLEQAVRAGEPSRDGTPAHPGDDVRAAGRVVHELFTGKRIGPKDTPNLSGEPETVSYDLATGKTG